MRKFIPLMFLIIQAGCAERAGIKMLVLLNPDTKYATGLTTIQNFGAAKRASVDTTTNLNYLTEDSLKNYSSVIFLNISADTLDQIQKVEMQRYVEAGGILMTAGNLQDTILNWHWMNKLNQERRAASEDCWEREYKKGKVCFINIGADPSSNKLLEKGMHFIKVPGRLDYQDMETEKVPEDNRFVVEVLDRYMYEPMEMVIFSDGRILYIERRGDVRLYDPKLKKTKLIAHFDVSITGNYEDGMLGVALDPDFEQNHWIYINYSPAGNIAKQNVSRFEMRGDSIITSSERIVLEIPTQRETCCHSGGHLTFGPDNNLYISTGDNTSSKESDGFTPIDERQGRAPFDAQKSSGNTHDLRGKILRIHPEPDGSYTIPKGNLFPKDGAEGKPEIYVMGSRNAFRFSVDPHNGFVYWGDVGPDGGTTTERGPESFDEFNQAKKPGNFGWPYFVADNKAYSDFDFATGKIGAAFDPSHPENLSPNNTGARYLPPAQKPMIWYPYGLSKEFPSLGKGSRSAMAGPVYYFDDFKNAASRFPKYYDSKLFIYEWARSWIKVVSFDENLNLAGIEPFLPEQEWYKPIDVKFGPDGSMYVLEYGSNYFERNRDSRLVKISYVEGNRQPQAVLSADKNLGAAPLMVTLSAEQSFDFDGSQQLTYAWNVPGTKTKEINGRKATVLYTEPGIYRPSVKVTDTNGKSSEATVEIKVGNESPVVEIGIENANRSFYFDYQKLQYNIQVSDKEDGKITAGIDPSSVFVSFDYLKHGNDLAILQSNAAMTGNLRLIKGKTLINNSDCKTCHTLGESSVGPSYSSIAERYKNKKATGFLAAKVLAGGNGNWGKNMMAAHPQHTIEEATEMVKYILSVRDDSRGLPYRGMITMDEHTRSKTGGFYVIRANYTDKGHSVTGRLTGSSMLILKSPTVEAEEFVLGKDIITRHPDGTDMTFISNINNGASITLPDTDLTDIKQIVINASARYEGSVIEIHIDSADGELIGQAAIKRSADKKPSMQRSFANIEPTWGRHNIILLFKNKMGKQENIAAIDWVRFENKNIANDNYSYKH